MSPRTAESNALANIMGVNDPIMFDQAECDAKIAKVVKSAGDLAAKNNARRDEINGVNAPTAVENRKKLAWYELKQDAKNAEVQLNCYGVPDVKHWTAEVEKLLLAKHAASVAGELGEERVLERRLQAAEAELVKSQERLEKFRLANTRAVVALQNWEHANNLVHAEATKSEKA